MRATGTDDFIWRCKRLAFSFSSRVLIFLTLCQIKFLTSTDDDDNELRYEQNEWDAWDAWDVRRDNALNVWSGQRDNATRECVACCRGFYDEKTAWEQPPFDREFSFRDAMLTPVLRSLTSMLVVAFVANLLTMLFFVLVRT